MISNSFYQENYSNSNVTTRRNPSIKSNKQLPERAVQLMNAWYIAHEDNPYPNRNELDYLATEGGIKESQVKAWFSNKRNRTQNTHPKRARRYLVRNQTTSSSFEPEKIFLADRLEQQANLVLQQQYSNVQYAPMIEQQWSWPIISTSYEYQNQ